MMEVDRISHTDLDQEDVKGFGLFQFRKRVKGAVGQASCRINNVCMCVCVCCWELNSR